MEVTLFEAGMEVGTVDWPAAVVAVGQIYDGCKVIRVEFNPPTGEDAYCWIEYVFL